MNDRLSPLAATSAKALAYRPDFGHEAMDETGDYAVTHARPADPDDVFSEDDPVEEKIELIHATPEGKWASVAFDACAALADIVRSCRIPANYDQFSEVDVDKWAAICARAGYRL